MSKKLALTIMCSVLLLVSVTTPGLAQPDYTIMTANNPNLFGEYLVDAQGRTLYYFTKDAPDISNCKGEPCSSLWPAFYTSSIEVSPGLDASDFGTITREDGMKQITFKGWPLYYFSKDMEVGDYKGQKFNGVWFVVNVN